jgi:hypothetical protein
LGTGVAPACGGIGLAFGGDCRFVAIVMLIAAVGLNAEQRGARSMEPCVGGARAFCATPFCSVTYEDITAFARVCCLTDLTLTIRYLPSSN